MKYLRIIARLDIKGDNLVKGVHLEGLRVLGKPEYFATNYFEESIDEIFFQDVVASLYQRNTILDVVSRTINKVSIPLIVGGGINKIDDITKLLKSGADRVAINSGAIKNPNLISEAANIFGSSTIVASIEAIKNKDGHHYAYYNNGREHSGFELVSWCQRLEKLGAGEICITSVDNDGTGNGFEIDLVKKINNIINVPIIIHGGCASANDIIEVSKYNIDNFSSDNTVYKVMYNSTPDKFINEFRSDGFEIDTSHKVWKIK